MTKNLRYIVLCGLFATPFIPFIIINHFFFPFITGKAFVFRIIVELVFGLWILLMLKDITYRPKRSWLLGVLALFVSVIFIADIFGVNFYRSFWSNYERMEGFVNLLHLSAYFLMLATVLKTEKWWNYFFNTSFGASVILCLFYALPQIYGNADIHQSSDRIDATFGNATYFAAYLLINMFLALFLLMRSNKVYLKWLYGIGIALEFFLMYKTQTRGALVGLVGGLFVSTILLSILGGQKKMFRKFAIGALVSLVLIVGGLFMAKDSSFVKSSPTLVRFTEISLKQEFLKGQGRYYIWPMAIKGFKEHPVLGWGQENFNYVFNKNYDPRMYYQEQWFDHTHNAVLDWLVSGGVLGLGAYLSIFVFLLYYIWRKKLEDFSITDKSILTGLIVGYFIQNLFVFDNITSYLLFVMILAYVYSAKTPSTAKPIAPNLQFGNTGLGVVAALLLVATIFTLYKVNIKPMQATTALIYALAPEPGGAYDYAKDLLSFKKSIAYDTFGNGEAREHLILLSQKLSVENVPNDLRSAVFQSASSEMAKQIEENKEPDARYYLFLGSLLGRYGVFDHALNYLTQAHSLSPRKQTILFELSNVYFAQNKPLEALAALKEAFDLSPEYLEARLAYFTGAIQAGKYDLANEIISVVPRSSYLFNERVLSTYVFVKNYDAAISILKDRVATDPKNPQYRLSLAAGYLEMGNKDMAIKSLQEFIEIDPNAYKKQGEYYISEIRAGRKP